MPENTPQFGVSDMFAFIQEQLKQLGTRLDAVNAHLGTLNGQTSKNTQGVFEHTFLLEDAKARIEDLEAWQSAPLRNAPKAESVPVKSEEDRVWTLRDAKLLGYGAGGVFALLKALPWLLSLAKP